MFEIQFSFSKHRVGHNRTIQEGINGARLLNNKESSKPELLYNL